MLDQAIIDVLLAIGRVVAVLLVVLFFAKLIRQFWILQRVFRQTYSDTPPGPDGRRELTTDHLARNLIAAGHRDEALGMYTETLGSERSTPTGGRARTPDAAMNHLDDVDVIAQLLSADVEALPFEERQAFR